MPKSSLVFYSAAGLMKSHYYAVLYIHDGFSVLHLLVRVERSLVSPRKRSWMQSRSKNVQINHSDECRREPSITACSGTQGRGTRALME